MSDSPNAAAPKGSPTGHARPLVGALPESHARSFRIDREDPLEKSLLRCFNLDADLPSKVLAARAACADTDGNGDSDDD